MLSYRVEENLEMRLVSKRYTEEVYSIVKENFDYLREWLPWVTENYTAQSALDFFKFSLEQFAKNEIPNFLIFLDGKVVGGIGFNSPDLINKSIEIGYWLVKDAQGNGIITKCCRALIDHSFNELSLNRIVIRCAAENFKSQAIAERLNFRKEGTQRESEWLHDRFVDLIVYSMLKKEWKDI